MDKIEDSINYRLRLIGPLPLLLYFEKHQTAAPPRPRPTDTDQHVCGVRNDDAQVEFSDRGKLKTIIVTIVVSLSTITRHASMVFNDYEQSYVEF